MKDSYQEFLNRFEIKYDDLINFGIEKDTIFPDPKKIRTQWNELVDSITTNNEVHIRGYGRYVKGTALYLELYKIILENNNIMKDFNNNAKLFKS